MNKLSKEESMLRTNLIAVYLLVASPALAVQTSHWTASGETDFKKGTMHNVVATNLGDLKLSRDVKTLIEENPLVSAVYAMVEAGDGTIYAATGPHGVLLRIKDGKAQTVATFEDKSSLFALLLDPDGSLIVGVSGDKGKVYRIEHPAADNATPAEIFSDDDAQYIWGLQRTADGNLYIATGPNGKLFELKADGAKSVLLASDESNLLSLLSDGKDLLYVGTDPNGLVYRINRKTRDVFILFDAPESEIGCLAMDKKGNLYAGTAEAQENPPGTKAENGESGKAGRPEGNGAVPLPSTPPQLPNPPAKPEPNPGEPNPIPKKTIFRHRLNGQHSSAIFAVFDNPAIPTPGDKPKPGPATAPANPAAPLTPATENPPVPRPQGNAIYRIDLDGFVTEIFRQPVMVLSMLEHNGVLLVGTGSDGLIYQVDPAAEETVVLAKVDPKQVLSILAAKDGRIVLGLANVGGIAAMSSGFAAEGTFTSPVLDATQISRFGKMHLEGSLPQASKLTVATRSGNVQDPGKAGWSAWSDDVPATEYVQTSSPSARFLQYRLTLASTDAKATPVVNLVDVAYQTPNVAPLIHSIRVGNNPPKASSSPPAIAPNSADDSNAQAPAPSTPPTLPNAEANRVQPITWEADDANGDSLVYSLYFHRAGISPWILLKDKLTESHFDWDTRTVADGRYEVKVVASDAPSNPPGQGKTASRVSDPLVIDNTPPVIYDVNQTAQGEHVTINAKAADATSIVSSIEYSLDSATDWQLVLPSNKMYDSPEEAVEFALPGLSSGAHQVTLRATDSKGNQAYHTVLITVAAAKK
jgi:sugar lactone lactonase YvrE